MGKLNKIKNIDSKKKKNVKKETNIDNKKIMNKYKKDVIQKELEFTKSGFQNKVNSAQEIPKMTDGGHVCRRIKTAQPGEHPRQVSKKKIRQVFSEEML